MIKRMLASSTTTRSGEGFDIRTPLGRATGDSGRYALDTVRVLPLPGRGRGRGGGSGGKGKGKAAGHHNAVVLEASDGHQAVCLVTPGKLAAPALVPAGVLPNRQHKTDVVVQRHNGDWRSSEGKVAPVREDATADASRAFPPVGEVLPELDSKARGDNHRHESDGAPLAIALDLAVLKKIADALGTLKLTLIVPPPPESTPETKAAASTAGPSSESGESACIRQPIGVCPASEESGVRGIGVIMPLQAEHDHRYFASVCEQVLKAEKRHVTRSATRRNGSRREA